MSRQNTPGVHAGAERLGAGLLGGEAPGVGRRAGRPSVAAGPFAVREDAVREPLAEALERALDAADVAEVGADAEDHGAKTLIFRRSLQGLGMTGVRRRLAAV